MSTANKLKGKMFSGKIASILLVVIVLEFAFAKASIYHNVELQLEIEHNNLTQEIFISPNSQRETYKPAEKQLVLSAFVDVIAKGFLSYSGLNVQNQTRMLRPYMSSAMLARFNSYYLKNLLRSDKIPDSIFKLDRQRTEIFSQEVRYDRKTGLEVKDYIITVKGERQFMIAGRLTEPKEESIRFTVQETITSEANPYGLLLTKFDVSKIRK
tara:strand:+ start:2650 stop:3285 length:636 start_codon:yes stop_codon:yes gene_type:complete